MTTSLHDNWLYAHYVDHELQRIVLHTSYPHSESPEYTDVIFSSVLVHHFETQRMNKDLKYPSNVLFDIEEEEAKITIDRYWNIIYAKRKHGWIEGLWNTKEELAHLLTSDGHRCFHIHGTVGLDGFVFSKTMDKETRSSKWINQ